MVRNSYILIINDLLILFCFKIVGKIKVYRIPWKSFYSHRGGGLCGCGFVIIRKRVLSPFSNKKSFLLPLQFEVFTRYIQAWMTQFLRDDSLTNCVLLSYIIQSFYNIICTFTPFFQYSYVKFSLFYSW